MRYSTTAIPFMVMDDTPIVMESASPEYWNFKKLSDFASIRGNFCDTDKSPKTYIFQSENKRLFAEFTLKSKG